MWQKILEIEGVGYIGLGVLAAVLLLWVALYLWGRPYVGSDVPSRSYQSAGLSTDTDVLPAVGPDGAEDVAVYAVAVEADQADEDWGGDADADAGENTSFIEAAAALRLFREFCVGGLEDPGERQSYSLVTAALLQGGPPLGADGEAVVAAAVQILCRLVGGFVDTGSDEWAEFIAQTHDELWGEYRMQQRFDELMNPGHQGSHPAQP